MLGIKLIDRYILRKFMTLWVLSILAFLTIFHVVDVIEKIDNFLKYNLTLNQVLLYYWYQLPWFVNIIVPMAVLLASVFTIGNLAKHNELTAIKSSSISMYRLSAPVLVFGLLISLGNFFFEDLVVIPATREKINMENMLMHKFKNRSKTVFDNITFQESPEKNIVIKRFYLKENTGNTVTIQESRNNKLVTRLDAKKMIWQPETKDWLLIDFILRDFDGKTTEKASDILPDTVMALDFHPDDIANTVLKPEEMSYTELKKFIERLKFSGNDAKKWEVNLYYKTAFSMTSLIVVLFGLPLTAYKMRKNTSFGAGVSLLVIFLYYGFITFGKALGIKGILPPFTAAWLANYFFLSLGLFMFYKIKQ
ncbi:MAG: LptF/LptG family permease [Candidatus Marinimicrobia bacterium]|nr:LptF/LptG family permease [Candidatus Neomarinimicrobiota bacterium]